MSAAAVVVLLALAPPAPPPAPDTLRLPALHAAAVATDPRARQLVLHADAHQLRLRNLRAERLPQFGVQGEGTSQSDVVTLPVRLPGVEVPEPPRTRYQASLGAEQLLYDGGMLRGREAVERARYREAEAEVRAALYPLRAEVDEAFFSALLLQVQGSEVRLLLADLDARLAEVRARVRSGAALPGDTAALQAERLRALQGLDGIAATRAAALAVLGDLTGRAIAEADVLAVPELAAEVAQAEAAAGPDRVRGRPEFARLGLTRERLAREEAAVATRVRPQLRAFGQAGAGRPGPLQLFRDDLNEFWLVGVRLQWQPWTWGGTARERELLRVQQQLVQTEEAALAVRLERELHLQRQTMRQLERALASDEQIIALREQVERQARRQFEERVSTASQYLAARTDVHEARVAWQRHRIELERARARYLTTIGVMPAPEESQP